MRPLRLLACLYLALPVTALAADSLKPTAVASIATHSVPRIAGDIVIDGALDEPAWQQAAVINLGYEVAPGDNLRAAVKTTARIAYTEDALLIAFHAQDPDPAQLRAFLRDRDALYNDDYLGVMLDTFDDQRRSYEFFVNPLGVQADLIRDEATGDEDDSWDGLWTSAARVGAHGYDVEMRIPFATLRFRDTDGTRRWAASFWRHRPRDHAYQYASHRKERGAPCFQCQFNRLEGFEGIRQGRNLEITPTLTVVHAEQRDAPGLPWQSEGTQVEPGLDVAWSPSPNLTFSGTLNPDFSQVESDEAQLDLSSSFALYFPEKRPFFLEAADTFSTPLQVLYTRQIADPDAGLRVTGRSGQQAYGVIAARDATTQLLLPGVLGSDFQTLAQSSDVLVGRYRYDLSKGATLGAITTLRNGEHYRNAVAGVDGRWQSGIHTFRAQWLRSESRYPGDVAGDGDPAPQGNALFAHYNVAQRHWYGNLQHQRVDEGFRADLGFISQVGYDKSVIGGGRYWYGAEGASISRVTLRGDWDITHRFDRQLLERELEAYLELDAARQTSLSVGGLTRVRYWGGQMFDERFHSLNVEATPRSGVQLGLYYRGGQQLDLAASRTGRAQWLNPWATFDLGRGINIALEGSWQELCRDGGTAYTTQVFDGRINWQLDPRQRLRLSVQATDIERDRALYTRLVQAHARDLAAQLLYSYKLNPRSALYAGYSHGAFADDLIDSVFDSNRSVFLKLSYAWQP